jgi:hypothetical protein
VAIEVLAALGERDATIAVTEQASVRHCMPMIIGEHLTVSEAVQPCAAATIQREATRLRKLADTSRQLCQRIIRVHRLQC